jgi:alkylation response protein AidB-like acyl-CoA dehydrogenase
MMNFELSEDQRAFQDTARDFAANELAPHAAEAQHFRSRPSVALVNSAFAACTRRSVGGACRCRASMHPS